MLEKEAPCDRLQTIGLLPRLEFSKTSHLCSFFMLMANSY